MKSIPCPIKRAVDTNPHDSALSDNNRTISYPELDELINAIITGLIERGIKSGNVVAVLGHNSIEYAALLFAAFRHGFTLMPLNCRLTSADWHEQISRAKADLLIYDEGFAKGVETGVASVDFKDISVRDIKTPPTSQYDSPTLDRDALIMFSSGSSGCPRGVVLTWRNLYYSALGISEVLLLEAGDCWLASLPFFHIGGISIPFRTAMAGCCTHIISEFKPDKILQAAASGKISHISVVPTMLAELIQADDGNHLAGLKAIILGGAKAEKSLLEKIRKLNLPVLTTYGLTETASMVSLLHPDDSPGKIDTAGKVLPYRQLKIDSTSGRVMVGGEVLFSRYIGEDTNIIDGWFKTEDVGSIDDQGFLTVSNRVDDVIISGGENINLGVIEEALCSIEGIIAAAVLSRPDKKWGQRPVAFAQLSDDNLTEAEILTKLREKLSLIMVPDRLIITDNIPLTGSGKYDRPEIRRQFAELFSAKD